MTDAQGTGKNNNSIMINTVTNIRKESFMMSSNDYIHDYLPLLHGRHPRKRGKQSKIPTAFVEFCDLEKPDSTMETPREYHDQFKPSALHLPKILPKVKNTEDFPNQSISNSYPNVPLASYHVPYTFTEGLSCFSAPKPPLITFQRSIPSANLPEDVRLSEERKKDCFVVEQRTYQDVTPRRTALTTACIPLVKREETIIEDDNVYLKRKTNEKPYLKFAPNVIYDKRPEIKVMSQNERLFSPYQQIRPTKRAVVPKEIALTDLNGKNPHRKKSIGNYFEHEIDRLREKRASCGLPSCVLSVAGVAKTKLELPFTILREKLILQKKNNPTLPKTDKKTSDTNNRYDHDFSLNTPKVIIKMPTTTEAMPRCISDALSEVAQLNTNNSNVQISEFDDENDQFDMENDLGTVYVANVMDETRLMSVEPDVEEQDQVSSSRVLGDSDDKPNIDVHCDKVAKDEEVPIIDRGREEDSTNEEESVKTLSLTPKLNYDTQPQLNTSAECENEPEDGSDSSKLPSHLESNPEPDSPKSVTDMKDDQEYAINCPKKRKLRLEVRVRKTTENFREVTTQMYYT